MPTKSTTVKETTAKVKKAPAATGVSIVRIDELGSWWCPKCDHSNAVEVTACGGCGAVRTGDKVK